MGEREAVRSGTVICDLLVQSEFRRAAGKFFRLAQKLLFWYKPYVSKALFLRFSLLFPSALEKIFIATTVFVTHVLNHSYKSVLWDSALNSMCSVTCRLILAVFRCVLTRACRLVSCSKKFRTVLI